MGFWGSGFGGSGLWVWGLGFKGLGGQGLWGSGVQGGWGLGELPLLCFHVHAARNGTLKTATKENTKALKVANKRKGGAAADFPSSRMVSVVGTEAATACPKVDREAQGPKAACFGVSQDTLSIPHLKP